MNGSNEKKYHAFISYRHADNKEQGRQWATWLHQAIETYEVPTDLIGKKNTNGDEIPARIYPIFRDEDELPANADLGKSIVYALEQSRLLIVLCSPRAVASTYVAGEIDYFKKLGHSDRIIAAIIDGEPNTSWDKAKHQEGFTEQDECFPIPLQFEYDQNGEPTNKRAEPIASDFRLNNNGNTEQGWTSVEAYRERLKLGKEFSNRIIQQKVDDYNQQQNRMLLKIIAGILGIPMGELTRRDKAYQLKLEQDKSKKLRHWLTAVFVLALMAAALGGVAYFKQKEAVKNEKIANEQRDSALVTQSRFLLDLARQENDKGNYDTSLLLSLNALPGKYGGVRPASISLLETRTALNFIRKKAEINESILSSQGNYIVTQKDIKLNVLSVENLAIERSLEFNRTITSAKQCILGNVLAIRSENMTELFDLKNGNRFFEIDSSAEIICHEQGNSIVLLDFDNSRVIVWQHENQTSSVLNGISPYYDFELISNGTKLEIHDHDDEFNEVWSLDSLEILEGVKSRVAGQRTMEETVFYPQGEAAVSFTSSTHQLDPNSIALYSRNTGEEVWSESFMGLTSSPPALVNKEKELLFISISEKVLVYDYKQDSFVYEFIHKQNINGMSLLSDGEFLLVGSEFGVSTLWSLNGLKSSNTADIEEELPLLVESPKRDGLVFQGTEHEAVLNQNGSILNIFENGQSTPLTSIDLSTTTDLSTTIDLSTMHEPTRQSEKSELPSFGQLNRTKTREVDFKITDIYFSADDKLLVMETSKSREILDWKNDSIIGIIPKKYDIGDIFNSIDESKILLNYYDDDNNQSEVWSMVENTTPVVLEFSHYSMSFSRDGRTLYGTCECGSGSSYNNPYVISAATGKIIFEHFSYAGIENVLFSDNGKFVLLNYVNADYREQRKVQLIEVASNKTLFDMSVSDSFETGGFFEDERYVMYGDNNKWYVYSTADGEQVETAPYSPFNSLPSLWNISFPNIVSIAEKHLPYGRTCLSPSERESYFLPSLTNQQWIDRGCDYFAE